MSRLPLLFSILVSVSFFACSKDKNIITVVPIDKVILGKQLFFDASLSNPGGQSCASCHNPTAGFSDPEHRISSPGAQNHLFSNRNCPTIAYTAFGPSLYFDTDDSVFVGGFFLDGRVNTLQEQAMKPFLNPLEMGNTDAAMVVAKLRSAEYYPFFKSIYGEANDNAQAFTNIADAISAFERSSEVNSFSSKFDAYLKGKVQFSEEELRGLQLFNDPKKGNCAACHISAPDEDFGKVLFTDFTYDNIGVPKNPDNPFYTLPPTYNPHGCVGIGLRVGNRGK